MSLYRAPFTGLFWVPVILFRLTEQYVFVKPAQRIAQTCVLRCPGEAPRWLLCFEHTSQSALTSVKDDEASRNAWQLADIRSGLAWLTDAQQDHFLPQMLNWEALGGISFKRVVILGQEVVARGLLSWTG